MSHLLSVLDIMFPHPSLQFAVHECRMASLFSFKLLKAFPDELLSHANNANNE